MLNLFALRATDPRAMMADAHPVGAANDTALRTMVGGRDLVVAAWGVHGRHRGRAAEVVRVLSSRRLLCFGATKDGHPRHPLYLRADTPLVPLTGSEP